MFLVVDNERAIQLKWVNAILATRRWRPNRLATSAGIDPSALSRFLNDATGKRTLNSYTIEKIEVASGFPAFETEPGTLSPLLGGFGGGDGAPYEAGSSSDLDRAVQAIKHDRNGIDPWILQTRCLENAGYLPGDILMVDLNARPKKGDVVVAQVFDRNGSAEIVIRLLGEPFLYASTLDEKLREPILIDKNVVIRGVLLTSLRERRAA